MKAQKLMALFQLTAARRRLANVTCTEQTSRFNSQPPEGGWLAIIIPTVYALGVSTHSRPKAAGRQGVFIKIFKKRFNSQPPEGGWASITMT